MIFERTDANLPNSIIYRNELKYCESLVKLNVIREKVSAVMSHDEHANETGKYSIHSLYFDDYTDVCARDNVAGEGERYKYRIRYYNESEFPLVLEKKKKKNSYCNKRSCLISHSDLDEILSGNASDLFWESEKPLLKEFCKDIITKHFSPKVIISYEREAFIETIGNVRVTFDSNIVASNDFDEFLTGDFNRLPILDSDRAIMEVKFDDVLPSYIHKLIEPERLTQQSFSKYFNGRLTVQKLFYKR